MAWWRTRVVAPVRRAWLAVAAARARVRKGECGILNLHQDVQTCGYQDVQVMWNMLSSEKEAPAAAGGGLMPKPRKRPFWRLPLWPVRPPPRTAARETDAAAPASSDKMLPLWKFCSVAGA